MCSRFSSVCLFVPAGSLIPSCEDNRKTLLYKRCVMTCGCSFSVQDVSFPPVCTCCMLLSACSFWVLQYTACAKVHLFLFQFLVGLLYFISQYIFFFLSLCETPWSCISPQTQTNTHLLHATRCCERQRRDTLTRAKTPKTIQCLAWRHVSSPDRVIDRSL